MYFTWTTDLNSSAKCCIDAGVGSDCLGLCYENLEAFVGNDNTYFYDIGSCTVYVDEIRLCQKMGKNKSKIAWV